MFSEYTASLDQHNGRVRVRLTSWGYDPTLMVETTRYEGSSRPAEAPVLLRQLADELLGAMLDDHAHYEGLKLS